MKDKTKKPLPVALYGMDGRTYKTMEMYLRGPCQGIATVVDEFQAEIDIIDADHVSARTILEARQQKTPERPIVLLSLQPLQMEGVFFVKKPVEAAAIMNALEQAKASLSKPKPKKSITATTTTATADGQLDTDTSKESIETESPKPVTQKKRIDEDEIKKVAKHQTSTQLSEGGYVAFLGNVPDINFDDPKQLPVASYNPRGFFIGYVLSAFRVAKSKSRVLQLNSNWKPILIFPHSEEIWVDADDKQLRAFAGMDLTKSLGTSMSLAPVDPKSIKVNEALEKFQGMDAFAWKLAIWTSKGRYPDSLDIERPVYLKRWPNFTRLVITPHGLRIAALLVQGPRTLLNVSDALRVKPQYVFVFVSACHALDLVGQAERQADLIVVPEEVKKTKKEGLLSKILSKLRG